MRIIVYGANCVWWDSIDKVAKHPLGNGLPCCPYCHSVLMQVDEPKWWKGIKQHESDHHGYTEFIKWQRGRCFPTIKAARKVYDARDKIAPVVDGVSKEAHKLLDTQADVMKLVYAIREQHNVPEGAYHELSDVDASKLILNFLEKRR